MGLPDRKTFAEKLTEIEDRFQKWIQRTSGVRRKVAYNAKDFLNVGWPETIWHTLYRKNILIPPAFHQKPEQFIPVLQEYLIDNVLFLYKEQIRLAVDNSFIGIFKDCGNQLGVFIITLKREGNLVLLEAGYSIYQKQASITTDDLLAAKNVKCEALNVYDDLSISRKANFLFLIGGSTLIPIFGFLGFSAVRYLSFSENFKDPQNFKELLGGTTFFCLSAFFCLIIYFGSLEAAVKSKSLYIMKYLKGLSPKSFPTHLSENGPTELISKNSYHQAFLEQVNAIVNKAVSLGEQAN
jgi:hypothetical protein